MRKARNLFWEKGYNATSMQDLVDAMQLNRGSIYDTYGDKHALFLQCLSDYADEVLVDYKSAAAGAASPMAALERIIYRAVNRTLEKGRSCMVTKSSFELAAVDKEVQAIIRKQGAKLVVVFRQLLEKAQAAGEISGDHDVTLTANFILASFSGWWQLNIVHSNEKMVHKMADYLISLLKR